MVRLLVEHLGKVYVFIDASGLQAKVFVGLQRIVKMVDVEHAQAVQSDGLCLAPTALNAFVVLGTLYLLSHEQKGRELSLFCGCCIMPFLAHFGVEPVSHRLLNIYLCIVAYASDISVGDYALKYFRRHFNAF